MAWTNGFQSQTAWITVKHYASPKDGGIWRDKAGKVDLQVTDRDLPRRKTRRQVATAVVERLIHQSPGVWERITPKQKWAAVDMAEVGDVRGMMDLLLLV